MVTAGGEAPRRRLKSEAGESPARSRHCDRGAIPRDATGAKGPGKARASRDPGVRRLPAGLSGAVPRAKAACPKGRPPV